MNRSKGSLYILLSALFYASYGVWSRLMAGNFGEFSQAWTRGLLLLIAVLIIGHLTRSFKPVKRSDLLWFMIIGLAGGLNQAPYFYGFKHLGVGTATLLFYAALVAGGYIFGKLIFKETLTSHKIISLLLALSGMFAIYQFALTPEQILPALATLLAGFLGSATVVFPKKLSHEYPEPQIMTSYFIAQILINLPLALLLHDPLPQTFSTNWLPQLGYAISMLIANLAVIKGFKHLEASTGSIIGTTEIIFGILFGVLLFHEVITMSMMIGTGLILLAACTPNFKPKSS
jgi:drug/metabolite transporter (DMT)-like permease